MIVSIIGTNGMLSKHLAEYFSCKASYFQVIVFGITPPKNYRYTSYKYIDLIKEDIDYSDLLKSDLIIYAAGAGVQAALKTDPKIMYELNLNVPINICNNLKKHNYKGNYISFGSYMEIGLNDDESIFFTEEQIELSSLPVTNDYALSKRLLTRFMGSLSAPYSFFHFILPNLFVKNEEGTRLIPYILEYLKKKQNKEVCEPPSFSSGNQIRQYIHFDDVCYVLSKVLEIGTSSGIYNIGGGEVLTIKELIVRLFDHHDISVSEMIFGQEVRRDGDIKCLKLNGDKLLNKIGFQPYQTIESIL